MTPVRIAVEEAFVGLAAVAPQYPLGAAKELPGRISAQAGRASSGLRATARWSIQAISSV